MRDAADLFVQAMAELGHPLRSWRVVLWDRVRQVTADVVAGTSPAAPEAVWEIAALLCRADHLDERGESSDFATRFELLALDWDGYPQNRDAIAEQITAACRELLIRTTATS